MTTITDSKLMPEQIEGYRRDGFIVARHVFADEEVAELEAEAQRLAQRADLIDSGNIRCRWQNFVTTGECRFDCFDPVIDISRFEPVTKAMIPMGSRLLTEDLEPEIEPVQVLCRVRA